MFGGKFLDMRFFYFTFLLLFSSTLLTSQSWALPNCPSSGYFHNCFGTYTWDDGDKYVGEWKDNKKNGQGTLFHSSGNKYVGEFKDNQRNGQGTNTWVSGDKYVGEWKDNKRNGQGTYTFVKGYVKEGIWRR